MFEYKLIKITWLGHDGFRIESGAKTIYIDPFRISSKKKADVVLITHEHYDHCSPGDIGKIATNDTAIVTIPMAEPALKGVSIKEIKLVEPGDKIEIDGIKADVFPAYNINKFRSTGKAFHTKEDGKVSIVGSEREVEEFRRLAGCEVVILKKEEGD